MFVCVRFFSNYKLCKNKNPRIIEVIQELLLLLDEEQDRVSWYTISENPNIFFLDIEQYKKDIVKTTEILKVLL